MTDSHRASLSLDATGLGKRFGQSWVLRDASLSLKPGQILALLGENGAGKSTLVKILSGALRPDSGHVRIGGQLVPQGRPDLVKQNGLRIVYQELSVCLDLSVEDNIMLGQEQRGRFQLLDRRRGRTAATEVLQRLGHHDLKLSDRLADLSTGQRQLVEISRALVGKARVLILDEPTSSLSREDTAKLFQTLHRLADDGLSIIYISHFLEEVRQLCDSYLVLRDGSVAGQGKLADSTEADIVRLMVGRSVEELFPQVPHQVQGPALAAKSLSGQKLPNGATFQVHRGEILGIAGLVGAGRTETMRVIAGLDPQRGGSIELMGKPLAGSVAERIHRGLAMVSEDRKHEGLSQTMSVQDNATLSRLDRYSGFGWLRRHDQAAAVQQLIQKLQIKTASLTQPVSNLSGGNQQKIALARAWHQDAACLILDEPTRGVDVGTKAQIYRLIGEAAAEGKAVVFVSSYFQELLKLCDRIAVMYRGRIVDVRPASQWTEHELLLASMNLSGRSSHGELATSDTD